VAEREGLHKARPSNDIECLTRPIWAIEAKGIFRGLSNRADPPPETEIAAPVGAGNGDQIEKQGSYSENEFYSTDDIGAIARTHPIIARHFFGFEELEVAA
jgi:hypothetical protein